MSTSPDYHRLVVLLINEMHIKENLVYNKHTGHLVGFVDLGELNNHLASFQRCLDTEDDEGNSTPASPILAKSVVAFMVRRLFTKLQFTYAQFPCTNLVGKQMFLTFWECVGRLERIGFKVHPICINGYRHACGKCICMHFVYYIVCIFLLIMQVLAATFDGASTNRKLVSLHDTSNPLLYKVPNIHADDHRYLFFSDPPT